MICGKCGSERKVVATIKLEDGSIQNYWWCYECEKGEWIEHKPNRR